MENLFKMREQMTASAGALIDEAYCWDQVDWHPARREVRRLQMRIAKVVQVLALMHIIDRVVSNRLQKGLSCMMGNYHVQFLRGKETRGS